MRVIAFDIETMVDEQLYQAFTQPCDVKLGNLKDPAKIAEKLAEAEARQRDAAALNPHVSRVLSFHIAETTDRMTTPAVRSQFLLPKPDQESLSASEAALLRALWLEVASADRIVTFNGASFDVPFVMRRSLLLGVSPSIAIEHGKYRVTDGRSNHIDVRRVLAETYPGNGLPDFVPGDLNYFALLLLGDTTPDDLPHTELAKLWAAGDAASIERIRRYGERDALRTLQMYHKLEGFYFN